MENMDNIINNDIVETVTKNANDYDFVKGLGVGVLIPIGAKLAWEGGKKALNWAKTKFNKKKDEDSYEEAMNDEPVDEEYPVPENKNKSKK